VTLDRPDVTTRTEEAWRPPLFSRPDSPIATSTAALRRFLDLQAGSIWRDLSRLLPAASGTVVDVGCGAQPYRGLFSGTVRYIGIDTDEARAHFGYEVPDTRYFGGTRWPVDDASVDVVLCTETLEHVPDPYLFLEQASRCLRPGGTLLLTVPFAARWHFIPYDYWRFTPSGLKRVLEACGFGEIHVYARGNAFTVACYKVMALLLRGLMPQGTRGVKQVLLFLVCLPLLPVLVVVAAAANVSLAGKGGDDCLGYTGTARKPTA
jgi:SAM-dependent methyltransferase